MVEEELMMIQGQSKIIKPKKFKRKPRYPVNVITTFNKFEGLPIDECLMVEIEKMDNSGYQENTSKENNEKNVKNVKKRDQKKISNTANWTKYFDKNKFEVLNDNHEEGIKEIISRNDILKTPKHCLKKCRRCNFKKRNCVLDSSSCKAIQQRCFQNKKGHHSQSPYCKVKKRSKFTQQIKVKTNIKQKCLDRNILQLVVIKIDQLESTSKTNQPANISEERGDHKKSESIIPDHLIPFLLMFIFLNYGSIVSPVDQLNRKESNSKDSIVKTAEYCARKLSKKQHEPNYFLKYCSKRLHKVLKDEPIPNLKNSESIQNILDVYDNVYYGSDDYQDQNQINEDQEKDVNQHEIKEYQNLLKQAEKQFCEDHINLVENENKSPFVIPQLDGLDDSESEDGELEKRVYAINCELEEIKQIVNLLRSFNFLWLLTDFHELCSYDQHCFFCNMRSACLRLRQMREKGPRSIKLNEFISQLNQYDDVLHWNWRENLYDLPTFIENTIKLLTISEIRILPFFVNKDMHCQQCNQDTNDQTNCIFTVDIEEKHEMTLKNLLEKAIMKRNEKSNCVHKLLDFKNLEDKCIILQLSQPTAVNILDGEFFNGIRTYYNSHSENISIQERCIFFRFNNQMYWQTAEDQIFESKFGIHKNVSILSISFAKDKRKTTMNKVDSFIYGKPVQHKLHKQYLKVLTPDKHKKKQQFIKEYEIERSKNEERKSMHDQIDKVRNQTPKRKTMNDQVDKVRDQTPKRKTMHDQVDKIRNKTPKRKAMNDQIDKVRNETPKIIAKKIKFDKIRNKTPKRQAMNKQIDKI